ncbi:MAG: hypothetical protein AB1656_08310 [Candidatus Omnitrophota bacterium]
MSSEIKRREFIQASAAGSALLLGASALPVKRSCAANGMIVSPGCRKSKVKVAKIYMGDAKPMWPKAELDLKAEVERYEKEFAKLSQEMSDVEFVTNALASTPDEVKNLTDAMADADGVLAVQLSMRTMDELQAILAMGKPTVLFAAPYSGHEWVQYGALQKQKEGELFDCLLTSDCSQLATAIRPIRAIHHLREAKILNITSNELNEKYLQSIKDKFGTEIKRIDRDRIMAVYDSIPDADAKAEAKRWISEAEKVVEPDDDEIFRSCKLALAFEKLLNEEEATVATTDCYGTMYHQLPAFPCIGNTRLNDMGLGGICESDLSSAMTHILFQGLAGKPGFISDPTMDMSNQSIILAHCLGSTKMDGPEGERAPYKLRTIMERQEGAVPQVRMRVGQKVTQAILIGDNLIRYFTGEVIDAPDIDRGCRTKITVRVDGDADKLWREWQHGLHRVTCYGDITTDLKRFCRFKKIELINEA